MGTITGINPTRDDGHLRACPTAGTLAIDHPYPVDDAVFAVWEGLLLFAYDLVQATGTVARARIRDGKRGELDVRW